MRIVSDILSALSVNQLMIFHEVLNFRLAMAQIEVQIMPFVIMRFFTVPCCIPSLRSKYTRSVMVKVQLPL